MQIKLKTNKKINKGSQIKTLQRTIYMAEMAEMHVEHYIKKYLKNMVENLSL